MPRSTLPRLVLPALLALALGLAPACGDSGTKPAAGGGAGGAGGAAAPADPSAGGGSGARAAPAGAVDWSAPPGYSFPADLPFDPKEWKTNVGYELIADPNAKRDMQDRAFTIPWQDFPPTLRRHGPNANLTSTNTLHSLMYESLLGLHPETEEHIPGLATHWKIDKDEASGMQTFTFRLDDRARWTNGFPVTSADVHASWWHRVQEDRKDPSNVMTYGEGFEEPKILDRLTFSVRTKQKNWRLFLYFSGMQIYPARECRIPGDQFLKDYNWKFMASSGPYHLASEKDLVKGESIILTRRDDWWGADLPENKGAYNFRKLRFLVIRDAELIWQKFKAGELDWYPVGKAQRWVDEIPKEPAVQKGWVQARRIFNQAPNGFGGFAFNTRKPPFDDKRVRLAFAHLFNRKRLIQKLFYDQYQEIHSTYPGSDWGAGNEIPNVEFDPDRAAQLLAEAGYQKRDQDGYLIGPDGKRFELTLEFAPPDWERIWLVVKEDIEAGGIKFNLKVVDPATLIKKVTDREFTIHFQSWGAILFPNPETSWRSSLADKPANNNITGFRNARVDELCDLYDTIDDRRRQKEIIREIDKLVCAEHHYAFAWYGGYLRVLYWNRFGQPKKYWSRITDDSSEGILTYWWWDESKHDALTKAMKDGTAIPGEPTDRVDVRPWDEKRTK